MVSVLNMVTTILDRDGPRGHRGNFGLHGHVHLWTATAILVTAATHFQAVEYILDRDALVVIATPHNNANVDLPDASGRAPVEGTFLASLFMSWKSNREGEIPSGQIPCGNGVVSG